MLLMAQMLGHDFISLFCRFLLLKLNTNEHDYLEHGKDKYQS